MLVEVESGFRPVKIGFGVFLRVALHLQSLASRRKKEFNKRDGKKK